MTVTINGTTGIAGVDGSAATPAVQGVDTNTGVFYGTDIVAVSTGGTERMRVDASGNVGIGTASPSSPLNVVAASSSLAIAINGRSADNLGAMYLYANDGTTQQATITASANEFRHSSVPAAAVQTFYTNAAERMRVDASGNVGIGATPGTILDVYKASGNPYLRVYTGTGSVQAYVQAIDSTYVVMGSLSNHDLGLVTNGAEVARLTTAGLFKFNSGYGSAATAYGCRAWVNFDGTGTVAIRASGNVTSITDNSTGDYTINFTTAMVDVDYSGVFGCNDNGNSSSMCYRSGGTKTTTAFRVGTVSGVATVADNNMCMAAIFR